MAEATQLNATGTICTVYDADGTALSIAVDEEREVAAAMEAYAKSGKTVDKLLEITSESGAAYRVYVSRITSMFTSTREQRAIAQHNNRRNFEEKRELRTEAGWMEPLQESDA